MSSTHSLEDVNKKVKKRGKVSSVHRGRRPAEDDKPYSRNDARNKSINRLTETYSPSLNFYPDDYEVSNDSYSADISSMSTKETKAKGKKKGGKKKGKEKDRKESNKTEENPPKSPEPVEEIKVSQGNLQEKRHSSIVRKNVEGGKRSDSILSLLKNSLHSKTSLSKANADPMVQRASNVVRPPSSRQFIVTKKSVADFGCSVPGDFSNLQLSGSTNKLLRASYQAVPRQESLKLNDIATQTAPHVCRQCDDSNYLMSRQMPNEASNQGRLASLAAQEAGNTYMYSPPNRYIPEVNAPYHYQGSTTVSGGLREDLRQSIISQSRNAPYVGAERGGQANHYAAYDADKAKLLKSNKSKYICYRVPNAENNGMNSEHDMRAQLIGNKSMMNKTTSSPLINYATRAPKERDCPSNIQLDPNAYKTTTTSTSETNAAQRWSRRSQNFVENSTGPARNRTSGQMKKSNLSPPMVSFKSNDMLADQVYEVGVSRSCDSVKTLKEWNTLVARDFQHLLQLYQNFQKLSFKYKLNDDYDFVSDVGNCSILKENQNNEDVMDYSDRSDQSEDKSIVILTSDDEALSNNNECSNPESHPENNVHNIITGLETSKEHHKLIKIFCAAKAASEVGIKVPGINSQGWVDDEFVKHLQLARQFDVRSTINYCAIQVNLLDEDAYEYLFNYVQLYCEFLAVKRDRIGCCNYMEQYQPLLTAFKKYLDIFFTFSAAKLFREERQKIPGLDEQGFLEEGFIDYVQNSVEFNLRVMIDRCNSFPATSFSLKHVNCYIQEYLRLYNCYQADLNKKCSQLTGDMNRTQTNQRKMTFDTNCSTDKGQSDLSDCNSPETEVQLVSLQVTSCNEVYARPCVQTDNPKATNCLNQSQFQNSGVINVSYRKSQPSNASADSGCQVEHSELYSLQEETEQAPPLQAVMQHPTEVMYVRCESPKPSHYVDEIGFVKEKRGHSRSPARQHREYVEPEKVCRSQRTCDCNEDHEESFANDHYKGYPVSHRSMYTGKAESRDPPPYPRMEENEKNCATKMQSQSPYQSDFSTERSDRFYYNDKSASASKARSHPMAGFKAQAEVPKQNSLLPEDASKVVYAPISPRGQTKLCLSQTPQWSPNGTKRSSNCCQGLFRNQSGYQMLGVYKEVDERSNSSKVPQQYQHYPDSSQRIPRGCFMNREEEHET